MVPFIETPYSLACENHIPDDENDQGQEHRGEDIFPMGIKMHLLIEA
jgi:hypothetical protein